MDQLSVLFDGAPIRSHEAAVVDPFRSWLRTRPACGRLEPDSAQE